MTLASHLFGARAEASLEVDDDGCAHRYGFGFGARTIRLPNLRSIITGAAQHNLALHPLQAWNLLLLLRMHLCLRKSISSEDQHSFQSHFGCGVETVPDAWRRCVTCGN